MTEFAIYPDKVPGHGDNKDKLVLFNTNDYSTIYSDDFIELVWNAIEKQPVFKIFKNNENSIKGGCVLLNSSVNTYHTFSFEHDNTTEYFFTTDNGSLPQDATFVFNNSVSSWNRSQLWLSSLLDEDFPYYDIEIRTSSTNGYAIIKKTLL